MAKYRVTSLSKKQRPFMLRTGEVAVQQVLSETVFDHGKLSGLLDDDHPQYLNIARHDTTARHGAGVVDHGLIGGLLDDDHTQYLTIARHDTTARHALGTVVPHDNHGLLSGLGDDDHLQYLPVNGSRAMAGSFLPSLTDSYDLGSGTRLWRKGYLSELDAVIFSEQTVSLIGGWLVVPKDQGSLEADAASGDTSMDFGKAMTNGHFVLFRALGQVEYVRVGALVSGTRYNVTRNLDGSGANAWPAGAAFEVLGAAGDGRIELNAYDTPRLQILKQGSTYNAQTELIRMGDLNGNWGYSAEKYGLALGEYAAGKPNILLDEDGNLKFRLYTTDVMTFASGNADITGLLRMPGDSSAIAIGAIPPTSRSLGTGIWIDKTGIYGLNAGVVQVKIDSTSGKLYTGDEAIEIDQNLSFDVAFATWIPTIKWIGAGGHVLSSIYEAGSALSDKGALHLGSYYTNVEKAYVELNARDTDGKSWINFVADKISLNGPIANSIAISARVYASAIQSIPNAAWTAINWSGANFDYDPFSAHWSGSAPTRLYCRTAGVYLMIANIALATNTTGTRGLRFLLNGATEINRFFAPPNANSYSLAMILTGIYQLAAGDYVTVEAYQNSGAALNTDNTYPPASFAMLRIA